MCTWRRNHHSLFPLDWFHHKSCYIFVPPEGLLEGGDWAIVDQAKVEASIWSEVMVAGGIIRTGTGGNSPSPKVSPRKHYRGLIWCDSFFLISPSSCELNGALSRLDSSVHKKNLFVSKNIMEVFLSFSEQAVVNSSRGQGDLLRLRNQSFQNFGVEMTLVNWGIGREEVNVSFALVIEWLPSQSVT